MGWKLRDLLHGSKALTVREERGTAGQAPMTATGRDVVIRPDLVIVDGKTMPGVTTQTACEMITASVRQLLKTDLVQVDVLPVDYCGRFARFEFTVPDWEGPVPFWMLTGSVDKRVSGAWSQYRNGWAAKAMQLHKRTQDNTQANDTLQIAMAAWYRLREAENRLLSDAEYLYGYAAISNAITARSLVPSPRCVAEVLVPTAADPARQGAQA